MGGGQGRRLVVQNTGMGLSAANAQRTGNNRQIAVGLAPQGGGYPRPLYGQGFAALVVQNFYFLRDKLVSAVSRCQRPRARCIRAAFSKGGSSLPRRSARLKIPAQAFGDKEYLSGAFSCKIADKKQTPAPLCCSEILGIVHTPSESNASASYHSGVCPLSRSRHWNFALCERRQHSLIVASSPGTCCTWDIFPEREFGVLPICRFPHFINNADGLHKEAAPLVREAPSLACH